MLNPEKIAKLYKRFFAPVLVLIICIFSLTTAFADETGETQWYEEIFETSEREDINEIEVNPYDILEFGSSEILEPGTVYEKRIEIANNYRSSFDLYLSSYTAQDILEGLHIEIYADQELIYDGSLPEKGRQMLIASLDPETKKLDYKLYVSDSIEAPENSSIKIKFKTEETGKHRQDEDVYQRPYVYIPLIMIGIMMIVGSYYLVKHLERKKLEKKEKDSEQEENAEE